MSKSRVSETAGEGYILAIPESCLSITTPHKTPSFPGGRHHHHHHHNHHHHHFHSAISPSIPLQESIGEGGSEFMAEDVLLRLGVDIGGTNTDAVILKGDQVVGWYKAATTDPVTDGLNEAIQGVIHKAQEDHGVKLKDIKLSMLGTTQFVNAVVQGEGLARVAVIRLCLPASWALPPFCDMPQDLVGCLGGGAHRLVHGECMYPPCSIDDLVAKHIETCHHWYRHHHHHHHHNSFMVMMS